jgi:hypothetical protein
MKVSIFHNTTRDGDRLAIFGRRGESRIKPGDELQLVGILDFPDADNVIQAANLAIEAKPWKDRPLSAGDVVAIEVDHTTTVLGRMSVGWHPTDLARFKLTGAVIVSLVVKNTYERYEDVVITVTDVVIPAPPADVDSEEYDDWAYEHIHDRYTGVGHTDGDSWYDVRITDSSDPELVGRTFEWGY